MTGVALVTGAAGQDGSYLLERLVAEGYAVHAVVRQSDQPAVAKLNGIRVHEVDLADQDGLHAVVAAAAPTEIYHLGGMSSVAQSWTDPVLAGEVTGMSAVVLLQAAQRLQERTGRGVHFLQASSAEIFGEPEHVPQDERTPIRPVSPYGAAKAFAQHTVDVYRGHGLAASSVILYNHESPRRPTTFVTRKISSTVAAIARTGRGQLALGNLDAQRDWGWAPDYVDAMVRACRAESSGNYVIATGVAHSVRDFVATAFDRVGISDWERHVVVDPRFFRPTDPSLLVGDSTLARSTLGWQPTRDFAGVVSAMVDHDVALLEGSPGDLREH